jgi:hypothetical protein
VTVRSDKINVLHFEGEPRFEVKFIRRALANDPSIRLASLIRTAENKYLRLGVNDADELNDGFPSADEDLYAFDVVIIGSADDDLLDDDQQQRLRRFVAKRGGSLIALGGAGAFSEGGFGGSALADLLPVVLPAKGNNQARSYRQLVKLVPTEEGFAHSALRLGLIDDTTAWDALPPLTVVNPLRRPKPGATVLLNGIDATDQQPLIVMASQHYGRGRVLVFAVRDSWRWQMHPSISPQDMTHERLWQQLVRWLGRPVATRLKLTTSTRHAIVEESVAVRVATLNRNFEASRETAPVVEVTSPLGDIERLALTPDPTDTSQFSGRFIAAQAGSYDISATLADSGSSRMAIHVDNTGTEFISAERNDTLLNRIAAVTGGQSLSFDDSGGLKSLVDKTMSTRRITRQFSLLDVPALYLAILLLAFIEWTLRRRWTLA